MIQLRLLADDLTGALDSAAAFASVLGQVRSVWTTDALPDTGSLVIDSGTRETAAEVAASRARALAPLLAPADSRLSFFKVDSLLRGNAGAELAGLLGVVSFDSVVIAPAIPFQKRRTFRGRQMRLDPGGWVATGEDIAATLAAAGHFVTLRRPGDIVPDGISMWDAETDADLEAIVVAAQGKRSVLYVGAAGLTGALARRLARSTPRAAARISLPGLPLLGLIGTDHPVMTTQLAAVAGDHLRVGNDIDAAASDINKRLNEYGVAFASCHLPALDRTAARAEIATRFAALSRRIPRPAALFVSGGETLAALCRDLGASSLDVTGEIEPGLPTSILRGGAWDGMSIISKSGAFGSPDVLARLIAALTPQNAKAYR